MRRMLCYPRVDAFEAKVALSRSLQIDKPRSVEVWCCVGANDVERLELRLRAASAGLRLHTAGAVVTEGSVSVSSKSDSARPGIIELASISSGTTFRIVVPYDVDSNMPDILIRLDAEYTTPLGVFQFFDHVKVPVELPLDVNVQDSFKPFALLSTFSIRTPDHKPLQLLSAALKSSETLDLHGPHGGPWPRLVLPQKPVHLQYVAKPKSPRLQQSRKPLSLLLKYQCFDEQLRLAAEHAMGQAIKEEPVASLRRLLVPYFSEHLMFHMQTQDWTQIAYQDEFTVPSFDNFGWDDVLEVVPPSHRSDVRRWLESWHTAHPRILLGNFNKLEDLRTLYQLPDDYVSVDLSSCTRQLTIPVTIPTVQLSPTVTLQIQNYTRNYIATDEPWPMGEPKRATLSILHTRTWGDAAELRRLASLATDDAAVQFVYEIDCNPDIWLVGGPKRGTFSQREGEEHRFQLELLLVPLRKGDWAVPSVDVRAVNPRQLRLQREGTSSGEEGMTVSQEGGEEEEEISCETYYEEQFLRVLVTPGVKSTTVGLMQGGGEASVLLDSRQLPRDVSA